jgi:hypothetical protein
MKASDSSEILGASLQRLLDEPLSTHRRWLWEEVDPGELALQRLDDALLARAARLIHSRAGVEELTQELRELEALVPSARRPWLDPWRPRWRTVADLLEDHLRGLSLQDPQQIPSWAHASEILTFVRQNPGNNQTRIAQELNLKAPNATRILAALEAQGLIVRREVGRKKLVFAVDPVAPAPMRERGRDGLPYHSLSFSERVESAFPAERVESRLAA